MNKWTLTVNLKTQTNVKVLLIALGRYNQVPQIAYYHLTKEALTAKVQS